MNRTYSHSFRPYASSPSRNQMMKSTTGFGLRTLWKDRDTHHLSTNNKPSKILKKKAGEKVLANESAAHCRNLSDQQEMKNFVKLMKKNSDEPVQLPKPAETIRNQATCRSARSIRSETRSLNESRVMESPQQPQPLTLDELQKKIEQLIQIHLWKKSKSRTFFNSQLFQDDLDKELRRLISEVKNYNINSGSTTYIEDNRNEDNLDLALREISQKIGIIEKIIAESYTESQMLKKYYSASRRSVPRNKQSLSSKLPVRRDVKNSTFTSTLQTKNPSIYLQTTSMSSYSKPSRQAYSLQRYERAPYLANRQPLPRSIYQRQFLYYGVVPTYAKKYDDQNVMNNKLSMKGRLTNYQSEFKHKKTEMIDSHVLDCRHDKFRHPKISFMPSKHPSFNQADYRKALSKTKKLETLGDTRGSTRTLGDGKENGGRSVQKMGECRLSSRTEGDGKENGWRMAQTMQSESRSKFDGNKCTIDSYIKDKNLNNLKYTYKLNFNA